MSGVINYSNKYASSWRSNYTNKKNIDFTATDFNSYKQSFIDYIKLTSPENFNDYTDNSELMILVNLLAYLGENLNYKIDLNSNDNFVITTERKTSLLNFAKMVSYKVSRNICASGIVKITQIMTDEDIRDSLNNSLKNIPISWNDITNNNWFEHFITVLNASLIYNNPYGRPTKTGFINEIKTTKYEFNTDTERSTVTYPFSANINAQNMNFEIINEDFENEKDITEMIPNPNSPFHIIYKNDGTGNSSKETGFFLKFKQGELKFKDFNFTDTIEFRKIEIDEENINNNDVWVEQIDENGSVIEEWKKVDSVYNTIYNDELASQRNIYEVVTELDDRISIKFSDGRCGNIPKGIFRVWYRISNGQTYTIKPQDIKDVSITIPYKNNRNTTDDTYNLTLTFSLMEYVSNSIPSEDIESIRDRAPTTSKTQNRMVSGEDYNDYPKKLGNIIKKISTVNRTYPGHSRYIDANDPTGTSQSTDIFGEDGIIYIEDFTKINEENLPSPYTTDIIVEKKLEPLLKNTEIINFLYTHYKPFEWNKKPKWIHYNNLTRSSIGYLDTEFGIEATDEGKYIQPNSLIKFKNNINEEVWAKIINIDFKTINGNNTKVLIISEQLSEDYEWRVELIYPPFELSLPPEFIHKIISEMNTKFLNGNSVLSSPDFGLCYNYEKKEWQIIDGRYLDVESPFDYDTLKNPTLNGVSAWLIHVVWKPTKWQFICRYTKYIFESVNTARFVNVNYNSNQNNIQTDFIKILSVNTNPLSNTKYNKDIHFQIHKNITYNDGYIEPRRIQLNLTDKDLDSIPDDPDLFLKLVPDNNSYIFYHKELDSNNYIYDQYVDNVIVINDKNEITKNLTPYFYKPTKEFFYKDNLGIHNYKKGEYKYYIGRSKLLFQYKHYAPLLDRIDPSPSSIMDMYVLTTEYNNAVLNWKNTINKTTKLPEPPTPGQLRNTLESIIKYKSATDSIVFHSIKFKLLFGEEADEKLRATFKIIKSMNNIISDNEISQKTIEYINEFFDVDNWNFGETFNFQQLANYIMNKFNGSITSCVIVPNFPQYKFGELFQIRFEPDELPLSIANISNVQIIDVLTQDNIKIGF